MPRKKPTGDLKDLTKAARKAVIVMRGGERLCKTIRLKDGGDTTYEYHFEPSGKRCSPGAARRVLVSRYVVPMGDGLLDPETSQTWAAK